MGLLTRSPAERRRRRQRGMMWVLSGITLLVLVIIGLMVRDIAGVRPAARSIALSVPERAAAAASRGLQASGARLASASPASSASPPASASPAPSASPTASVSPSLSASPAGSAQAGLVTDSSSGLSYGLLSSPWQPGCPGALDTPMFSWSAGESAVAGQPLIYGSATDWYGVACSGPLQPQFQYSGVFDLEATAMSLVDSVDLAYYSWLPHDRTLEDSSGIQVSGNPAWSVTFLMTYPDAAAEGLTWSSETAAVVVVDRGAGQVPAVFYASVPNDLGPTALSTLIGSLQLGGTVPSA